MIFTVGHTISYQEYFNNPKYWNNGVPQKAKGGSVWKTKDEVLEYLSIGYHGEEFSIYGVLADWEQDTENTGKSWNNLLRDADLIRLTD